MAKIVKAKVLARKAKFTADIISRGLSSEEYDFILSPNYAPEPPAVVAELANYHKLYKSLVRGLKGKWEKFYGKRALILINISDKNKNFGGQLKRVIKIFSKHGVKIKAVAIISTAPRMVRFAGEGLNGNNPKQTLNDILSRFRR